MCTGDEAIRFLDKWFSLDTCAPRSVFSPQLLPRQGVVQLETALTPSLLGKVGQTSHRTGVPNLLKSGRFELPVFIMLS
jgi:hypothetical protein